MSAQTVAVGRCGPAWQRDVPIGEQPGVAAHLEFMADLVRAGILSSAGPFAAIDERLDGDIVGLLVFADDDRDEAARVLAGEPAAHAGLVYWQVYRWHR